MNTIISAQLAADPFLTSPRAFFQAVCLFMFQFRLIH